MARTLNWRVVSTYGTQAMIYVSDEPCQMALIVGIASGTVKLISVGSEDRASSGFHCVMTNAWPG